MKQTELNEIESVVDEAKQIAEGDYTHSVSTATNHARLQALQIKMNSELIKTIRHLDRKNSVLQKFIAVLSVVATIATVVALLK